MSDTSDTSNKHRGLLDGTRIMRDVTAAIRPPDGTSGVVRGYALIVVSFDEATGLELPGVDLFSNLDPEYLDAIIKRAALAVTEKSVATHIDEQRVRAPH